MKYRCIRQFGFHGPGDEVELPDDAAVDPAHYEPVAALAPPGQSAPPVLTPKEGM